MALTPWRDLARTVAAMAGPAAGAETVSSRGAAGRILAADAVALTLLPAFSHAVMDGYALGGAPPGSYRLVAGRPERLALDEASVVAAGEAVPAGAVAVVLADKALASGGALHVSTPPHKDNIRRAGEEARPGAVVLEAGTRLDARHLALAAATGIRELTVRRRPRIALLALLGGVEALPHLGVMEALLASPALALTVAGATRREALAGELKRLSARHELLIIVGESLGDEAGPLATALSGAEVRVRRAALKPAKPMVTARLGDAVVIGLSGTAYAVAIAAHLFLRPLLRRLTGLPEDRPLLPAVTGFDRPRRPGRAEALPASASWSEGALSVSLAGRFGQLSALAALDGFALIEAEAEDVAVGAACLFHPLAMPLA